MWSRHLLNVDKVWWCIGIDNHWATWPFDPNQSKTKRPHHYRCMPILVTPGSIVFYLLWSSVQTDSCYCYIWVPVHGRKLNQSVCISTYPGRRFMCCSVAGWDRQQCKVFTRLIQDVLLNNTIYYTHESKKHCQELHQMLTDFQNSFTNWLIHQ